jgi:Outer membrane protein beta-barrel domain
MKRIVLFFTTLFLLQANLGFGQRERIINLPTEDERKIHFGYYLGLNNNSYKVSYLSETDANIVLPPTQSEFFVEVNESIGFNLGFIVDLRLHKNINLRFEPGLMSNSRAYFL